MPVTLTLSRSILMHASLAYLSPEIQALDSAMLSRNSHLPTELLWLIRSHLLPLVVADSMRRSIHALVQYEKSLHGLLCSDCVVYNYDIYGPDVWQWEQFSGACACTRVSDANIFNHPRAPGVSKFAPMKPTPKLFRDRMQWLEDYLSAESQRILGAYVPLDDPSKVIWKVVEEVLIGQNCRVLRGKSDYSIYSEFLGERGFSRQKNLVTIASIIESDNSEGNSEDGTDNGYWDSVAVLRRAKQNLGLDFDYDYEGLEKSTTFHSRFRPHPLREFNFDSLTLREFALYAKSAFEDTSPLQAIAALAALCLSLPLTIATLTLTILCFYSRPKSFRIL